MRGALLTMLLCIALALAACGGSSSSGSSSGEESSAPAKSAEESTKTQPKVTVPSGPPPKQLVENDLVEGSGAEAKAGDEVTVQYVGVGYTSKEEFDSSWSRNEPFPFALGAGQVIPGWEEGIVGMKVGGRRELIIPPELAYGTAGSPPAIGPNETLIFVVDLLSAE
ncbi:MAG TPA: FKBP-type peptidyl-prolyl cis-trans isomerase [Solirubrobacterales bacterium]|jgi:peptidylprolyl isomerase|nr:FKBP-type peptidyl-prolyl cis-trans isomerase [Solirubrobacterales bacterium]